MFNMNNATVIDLKSEFRLLLHVHVLANITCFYISLYIVACRTMFLGHSCTYFINNAIFLP